jgi:hydrogenase nickel incorporation protein HypA/HybF
MMNDLVRKLEAVSDSEGRGQVRAIRVRLGALSHFTPQHFREHFEQATQGTIAEGASVDAQLSVDTTTADAQGVVLESVEIDVRESRNTAR